MLRLKLITLSRIGYASSFLYFLILILWHMGVISKNPTNYGLPIWAEVETLFQHWNLTGVGDLFYYFGAGYSWYQYGIFGDPNWHWVTNLWPPGMPLTHFLFLKISLGSKFFLPALYFFTGTIWAILFTYLVFISAGKKKVVIFSILSIVTFTAPFKNYIFSDSFALPTGYSVVFFLLILCIIIKIEKQNFNKISLLLIIISGVFLTMSAFYRITYWIAVQMLILFFLLMVIFYLIKIIKLRLRSIQFEKKLILLFLLILIPSIFTYTYTYNSTKKTHPGSFSYTLTQDALAYGMLWRTNKDLDSSPGTSWTLKYGVNWACNVDKETCEKIKVKESTSPSPYSGIGYFSGKELRNLAAIIIIKKPINFVEYRSMSFWMNWSQEKVYQGAFYLGVSIFALIVNISRLIYRFEIFDLLFFAGLVSTSAPLIWVLHYPGYFDPVKILSIIYLIILYLEKENFKKKHLIAKF